MQRIKGKKSKVLNDGEGTEGESDGEAVEGKERGNQMRREMKSGSN